MRLGNWRCFFNQVDAVSPGADHFRPIGPSNDRHDTNDDEVTEDMKTIDVRPRVL